MRATTRAATVHPDAISSVSSKFWTGDRLGFLPRAILVGVAVVTAIVFVIAGLSFDDFKRAWDTLTGQASPFNGEDSGIGLVLSALGYIVVPATIGLAIADGVTTFTRKRLSSVSEAQAEINQLVVDALNAAAEEAKRQPGPGA